MTDYDKLVEALEATGIWGEHPILQQVRQLIEENKRLKEQRTRQLNVLEAIAYQGDAIRQYEEEKKLRRLLCFVGLHDWDGLGGDLEWGYAAYCKRPACRHSRRYEGGVTSGESSDR